MEAELIIDDDEEEDTINRNFFIISSLSLEKQTLETISIKSKDQPTISKPQEDSTRRSRIVARALEEVYFYVSSFIHRKKKSLV